MIIGTRAAEAVALMFVVVILLTVQIVIGVARVDGGLLKLAVVVDVGAGCRRFVFSCGVSLLSTRVLGTSISRRPSRSPRDIAIIASLWTMVQGLTCIRAAATVAFLLNVLRMRGTVGTARPVVPLCVSV